jgi:hypothetical protein
VLRFTTARGVFDRVPADDVDRNGIPDLVDTAASALDEARDLFATGLGVDAEGPSEVLLARIDARVDGYAVAFDGSTRLVLDVGGGADSVRRAAIHQYAHAVALELGAGVPPSWGEAFATWAVMQLTGGPHDTTLESIAARLDGLDQGLDVDDLQTAAGNAVWFAFLEQSYGAVAVRLSIEELSTGDPAGQALDRALRRAAGTSLAAALREFQLWALLVGDRAVGEHFRFAERLAPSFCSTARGLPALSVLAEEPLAPLGACAVLLKPETADGGLRLRFDGDFTSAWQADLLLVARDGELERLEIPLTAEGSGDVTVPLTGLAEAILLVRNLGGEEPGPRRYGWAAELQPGYPVELASFESTWSAGRSAGVVLAWETASEQQLLGFNVLRGREGGPAPVQINPVWIPAMGGESEAASYRFLDLGADPDTGYVYRLEAVTLSGLTSVSTPVAVAPRSR